MSGQMILAIETALGGGSVALLGGDEILYQHSGSVSRAAELILAVDEALESARSPVTDLQMIAVSTGPGSFTGIRVGIATALGLARSREIAVSGISLFDAEQRLLALGEDSATEVRLRGDALQTLNAATVSRQHARISQEGKDWRLYNLSKTNPVVLNGRPMEGEGDSTVLHDGDRVEMGEVVFRYHSH